MLAFLIKMNEAVLTPELISETTEDSWPAHPPKWKAFNVTSLFNIDRGDFHSIADLDPGPFPTISRVSTDNGLVGLYDMPRGAEQYRPGTVTVSTVTGDTFVQPIPFIATDNVLICTPIDENIKLTSLFFIQLMMNEVKWRYSYGRQPYIRKFKTTKIMLPVNEDGSLDEGYMSDFIEGYSLWPVIRATFEKRFERYGK